MLSVVAMLIALQQGLPTATIEGTVVRAGTSFPVAGIQIRVIPDSGNPFDTVTDGSGRFVLQDVPAGRLRIEAQSNGYVFFTRLPGSATFRDPVDGSYRTAEGLAFPDSIHRQTVNASAGESLKLAPISATAASVLRGRVLDKEGHGIPDATLSIIAEMADSLGRRQLITEMRTARTDEHGEYREDMLAPGTYFLRATVEQPGAASMTLYYPSTTDSRAAGPVVLSEGGESTADISIPERLPQTFRIAGNVVPLEGATIAAPVELLLKTQTPPTSRVADGTTSGKTGRFELRGVPAGLYDLFASARIGTRDYFAKVAVDIRGSDVDDLTIVLKPSVDVKGSVVIEGDPINLQTVRLSLNRKDGLFGDIIRPVFDDSRTGFVFRDVPPGDYQIAIRFTTDDGAAHSDSYVADIRAGGRSVFDSGFEVGVDATDALEIILGAHGGSISGNVAGLGSRQSAMVILAPERRTNAALFGAVTTNEQGQFELHGLTPGTYKIFAVPQGAILGRVESLAPYESRAVTVAVQKGIAVGGVQVPLISPDR